MKPTIRRSSSNDQYHQNVGRSRPNGNGLNTQLPPIPGSPHGTDASSPGTTPKSRKSTSSNIGDVHPNNNKSSPNGKSSAPANGNINGGHSPTTPLRNRSKSSSYVTRKSPPSQSLNAAVEMLSQPDKTRRSTSDSGHGLSSVGIEIPGVPRLILDGAPGIAPGAQFRVEVGAPTREKRTGKMNAPPSPSRPVPNVPGGSARGKGGPGVVGKDISGPVLNHGKLVYLLLVSFI
jgi:hypothetical protein